MLWAVRGATEANVIVRSHVHYFNYCGGSNWLALTTPALMGLGDKYGSRVPSGTVDYGLISFECYRGAWNMQDFLIDYKTLLSASA